jgi:chromosome condensin MukBEF ATPase and DNA-binding subunit MukB
MKKEKALIPQEVIEQKIYLIRGKKVMLDGDLANIYGVEKRALNQAVKRNAKRFPDDFMFQLNDGEFLNLKSQIVISSWGGSRSLPYAFTEQGVAMLSGILNSNRAIEVNVQIIRTFVKLREMIISNKELRIKMEDMERKYDKRFKVVFDTLRSLIADDKKEILIEKKEAISFKTK